MAFGGDEFAWGADKFGGNTQALEDFGVGFVGALESENTDGDGGRYCECLIHRSNPI